MMHPQQANQEATLTAPAVVQINADDFQDVVSSQHRQQQEEVQQQLRPDHFDQLRAHTTNVERVGNLDVISTTDIDGKQKQLGFCHIPYLLPLTRIASDGSRAQLNDLRTAEQVAAMLLAMRHLNTGDGSVVSAVEGLNKRCNIRFTGEVSDTELSEITAVNSVLDILARTPAEQRLPCAFFGSYRSAVSMPTSIISGILDYPQMSPASTSTALNDKSQYSLFGRTIPSDDGTSIPAIQYLRNELNVKHLGILYANDSYGSEYARSLQKTVAIMAPDMKVVPVEIPAVSATKEDFETAVSALKFTQYRYIFAIVFGDLQYNDLMEEAVRQGIAGPGFTWIFADATQPTVITDQQFEPGSPLAIASQGISVLKAEGGVPGMPAYDRLHKALGEWSNEEDSAYVDSHIPQYEDDDTFNYIPAREFLKMATPPISMASFLYDATIALGLAACNLTYSNGGDDGLNVGWEGGGSAHFDALMNAAPFEGATGNIIFNPSTGGRDPNSAVFQLTNLIPNEELDPKTGLVTFRAVPSKRFQNGEWETLTPYVFSDGTSNVPSGLPPVNTDLMHIGTGLRVAGLILSFIAMMMAVGFLVWTYLRRNGKVVKVSQPIFLYMICFGNFLMATAIIPLSFDDDIISESACNITCMVPYWLFCVGFSVALSALCSKTWRLNKLFYNQDMRRMRVSNKEVLKPTLALLVLNIMLLTIWTVVDPLRWNRTISQYDAFDRPSQSQGYCKSDFHLLFIFLLGLLNGGVLLLSLYQVYRARFISNEFGETNYILAAAAGMVLVTFVGLPVMVIASENPRAHFFVLSCIIFVICTLFLLFIFVPKIQFHKQIVKGEKSMRSVVREFTKQSAHVSKARAIDAENRKSSARSSTSGSSGRQSRGMLKSFSDHKPKMSNMMKSFSDHIPRGVPGIRKVVSEKCNGDYKSDGSSSGASFALSDAPLDRIDRSSLTEYSKSMKSVRFSGPIIDPLDDSMMNSNGQFSSKSLQLSNYGTAVDGDQEKPLIDRLVMKDDDSCSETKNNNSFVGRASSSSLKSCLKNSRERDVEADDVEAQQQSGTSLVIA